MYVRYTGAVAYFSFRFLQFRVLETPNLMLVPGSFSAQVEAIPGLKGVSAKGRLIHEAADNERTKKVRLGYIERI